MWGTRVQGCWWHCCGRGKCWELGVPCHPGPPPVLPPPTPLPLCSCRWRCPQHGAHAEGAAEQTPAGDDPQTPGAPRQGDSEGSGPCSAAHARPGAFPRQHPPPCSPSPPKTPQPLPGPSPRPSPYLCPAHTAAPGRAACPAPAPSHGSAASAPLERGHPPAWHSPMAELGLSPHPGLREGPTCPPASPQPHTELSPSLLAAPTHGHPRGLRGERRGRGVPADQGGGGVLVPTGAARGSPGWARGSGGGGLAGWDGDGARGGLTLSSSSAQTTAKGLPRRVPPAPETDPALQVRRGCRAPMPDPAARAAVPWLTTLSLSRCTTAPAASALCVLALPAQR